MKIAFYTLGCKVNQYETEVMRESFASRGHTLCGEDGDFDAAVINSCTVTAESDRKTRQLFHRIRRSHPNAAVVLAGCMPQAFPEKAGELGADVTLGNTDHIKIAEYTEKFLETGQKIFAVAPHTREEGFNTPCVKSFAGRTRAYVKIEDGCERYCTYCTIPAARGFVRSRPIEEIKTEAETLARAGFSEIVLVGINLSAYGRGTEHNLCDAVDAASSPDGIKRVRLGSLEPDHISDGMLRRFAANQKFCEQFHLSLQSGCDATLKRMNRRYDGAFYADLVSRIRRDFENAAVTTDIMVGFPGEDEGEFLESLEFVRRTGFSSAHIFAYSRRAGTVAAALPGQVSAAEKARRSRLISEVTDMSRSAFLKAQTGRMLSVLFEGADGEYAEGYAANYVRVRVKDSGAVPGKLLRVKITAAERDYCIGELV